MQNVCTVVSFLPLIPPLLQLYSSIIDACAGPAAAPAEAGRHMDS